MAAAQVSHGFADANQLFASKRTVASVLDDLSCGQRAPEVGLDCGGVTI
jgi:hypothetical protein